MKGLQCPKYLYLTVHQPHEAAPVTTSQQAIFDQGHTVGSEAQKRFPNGVLIIAPFNQPDQAVEETAAAIRSGALVLYEAAFHHEDVLVRIDILHRDSIESPWNICEVKSSTEVKNQHIEDAAIQSWVLRGCGEDVKSVSIMHINNECVFPNLEKLFTLEDVTTRVEGLFSLIPGQVAKFKEMLQKSKPPKFDIGPHCDDPYECGYKSQCWRDRKLPDLSVLDVPNLNSKKKWELYRKGIVDLAQLISTEEKLSIIQRRMIEVSISNQRFIDFKAIRRELSAWTYPLHFLDFETIGPAIPRYLGTRPYEQVPFQFSCHVQSSAGGPIIHTEYLHDSKSDPREPLVKALVESIGDQGSVVAYNKGFESGCLSALARALPKYSDQLLNIAERLVDPLPIIREYVYDREFKGSFSIKSVAPALLGSELSYDGMSVSNGSEAQVAFDELISGVSNPKRKVDLRQAMLDYCRKDTIAMVNLVEWLFQSSD